MKEQGSESEFFWANTSCYQGKMLRFQKDDSFAWKCNAQEDRSFFLYRGRMRLFLQGASEGVLVKEGESYRVSSGRESRMLALERGELLEVASTTIKDVGKRDSDSRDRLVGANDSFRVQKPWGFELIWAKTDFYVGKILHVEKGHQLSFQYHRVKDESIFLLQGKMLLVLENDAGVLEEILMEPEAFRHILPMRKHRMIALETCDVFEVSTPELEDVVRLEDEYGRVR